METIARKEAAMTAYKSDVLTLPANKDGKANPERAAAYESWKAQFDEFATPENFKVWKAEFVAEQAAIKAEAEREKAAKADVKVSFPAMPQFAPLIVPANDPVTGQPKPLTAEQKKENRKAHHVNLDLLCRYCVDITEQFEVNPKASKDRLSLMIERSGFSLTETFAGHYVSVKDGVACVHELSGGYVAIIKPDSTDLTTAVKSVKLTAYTLIKAYAGVITDYIENVHNCERCKSANITDVTEALMKTVHKFGIDLKDRKAVTEQRKANSQFTNTINKALTERHKQLTAIIKK